MEIAGGGSTDLFLKINIWGNYEGTGQYKFKIMPLDGPVPSGGTGQQSQQLANDVSKEIQQKTKAPVGVTSKIEELPTWKLFLIKPVLYTVLSETVIILICFTIFYFQIKRKLKARKLAKGKS